MERSSKFSSVRKKVARNGNTTADFVQALIELVDDMENVPYAAIVVGFESNTSFRFVFYHGLPTNNHMPARTEFMDDLNKLIHSGGEPLGLVGFELIIVDPNLISAGPSCFMPFAKYHKEQWALNRLAALAESFRERCMEAREAKERERAASLN